MSGMQQEIISRLSPLAPQHIEFHDDSHRHAGHADNNGGGHFRLLIVSQAFHGLSRLQRQRAAREKRQQAAAAAAERAIAVDDRVDVALDGERDPAAMAAASMLHPASPAAPCMTEGILPPAAEWHTLGVLFGLPLEPAHAHEPCCRPVACPPVDVGCVRACRGANERGRMPGDPAGRRRCRRGAHAQRRRCLGRRAQRQ